MKPSSSTPPDTLLRANLATADTPARDFGFDETAPAPSARASEMSGLIIQGRYRLETPLARGGMSVLYKATQLLLGRAVAVKIMIAPTTVANDAELEQRFVVEARSAAQLRHPNSIVVHDYGRTDDGYYFIVMEYLDGRDLARAIAEDGPFPPARAQHIALQVCESLIEAHGLGIVHRDVKPLNVFLSPVGEEPDHVKVLDFGLAKLLGDASAMQTRAGLIMGTPAYMSPEQVLGEVIDARSDIYSFGALLFHMLAGDAPYGTRGDYSVMEAHVKTPVPSLRSIHRSCRASAQLEAVILRCMAKDPAARYGSMREVADALVACPPERCRPVLWRRTAAIAVAAIAVGAVLLGVFGLPGSAGGPSDGAGSGAQPVTATMPGPVRPSEQVMAAVNGALPVVGAAPAEQPATATQAVEQPAEAAEPPPAVAEQPAEAAEPPPAETSAVAEQPVQTAADPLADATPEVETPPRVRGMPRRLASRRTTTRRNATQPRRQQPAPPRDDAQQPAPPRDDSRQPATRPPDEDRAGPAVRRNPDPWDQ